MIWGSGEWNDSLAPYHRACSVVPTPHLCYGHLAIESSSLGSQSVGHFMKNIYWPLGLGHQHLLTRRRRDACISSNPLRWSLVPKTSISGIWVRMKSWGPRTSQPQQKFCDIFAQPGFPRKGRQCFCTASEACTGQQGLPGPLSGPFGSSWFGFRERELLFLYLTASNFSVLESTCGSCQKSDSGTHQGWGPRIYILMSRDTDATLERADLYLLLSDPFPVAPCTCLTDWSRASVVVSPEYLVLAKLPCLFPVLQEAY